MKRTDDGGIPLEANFLLELCRSFVTGAGIDLGNLVNADWGYIVTESIRQKVFPLVANYIANHRKGLPPGLHRLFDDSVSMSRYRQAQYHKEAIAVQAALAARGIVAMARKGPVFQALLYGDETVRLYHDLDFFLGPTEQEAVTKVLGDLGYFVGSWNSDLGRVTSWTRKEVAVHQLFPDHLPRLVRNSADPWIKAIHLDFATDMTWHGSRFSAGGARYLATQFETPRVIQGLTTLSNAGHFVDCSLHLFREAYFENGVVGGYDVSLRKFLDAWLLWRLLLPSEREDLKRVVFDIGLGAPIQWAMGHLDEVFGPTGASAFWDRGCAPEIELASWSTGKGEIRNWSGSMITRLFQPDRTSMFPGIANRGELPAHV